MVFKKNINIDGVAIPIVIEYYWWNGYLVLFNEEEEVFRGQFNIWTGETIVFLTTIKHHKFIVYYKADGLNDEFCFVDLSSSIEGGDICLFADRKQKVSQTLGLVFVCLIFGWLIWKFPEKNFYFLGFVLGYLMTMACIWAVQVFTNYSFSEDGIKKKFLGWSREYSWSEIQWFSLKRINNIPVHLILKFNGAFKMYFLGSYLYNSAKNYKFFNETLVKRIYQADVDNKIQKLSLERENKTKKSRKYLKSISLAFLAGLFLWSLARGILEPIDKQKWAESLAEVSYQKANLESENADYMILTYDYKGVEYERWITSSYCQPRDLASLGPLYIDPSAPGTSFFKTEVDHKKRIAKRQWILAPLIFFLLSTSLWAFKASESDGKVDGV